MASILHASCLKVPVLIGHILEGNTTLFVGTEWLSLR